MFTQPKVRPPRAEAGGHLLIHAGRALRCSLSPASDSSPPRWSRGVALCPVCWHPLSADLQEDALDSVAVRLGTLIALGQSHLADDWDDSSDGSFILASTIEERLPLSRLATEERRKAIFAIAQLQHRVIALDSPTPVPAIGGHPAGSSFATRGAWGKHYENLIHQSCTDLVKATIK